MIIFVDDIPIATARKFYDKIKNNPVRMARLFFPERQGGYVKATKLLGSYFINRYTAFDLLNKGKDNWRKYAKICADIWCDLPGWARKVEMTDGTE